MDLAAMATRLQWGRRVARTTWTTDEAWPQLPAPLARPAAGAVSDVKGIKAKGYSCDPGTLSTRQAGKWFLAGLAHYIAHDDYENKEVIIDFNAVSLYLKAAVINCWNFPNIKSRTVGDHWLTEWMNNLLSINVFFLSRIFCLVRCHLHLP